VNITISKIILRCCLCKLQLSSHKTCH